MATGMTCLKFLSDTLCRKADQMATWTRVTKARPCPICGKPDWCLSSQDGSAAICPRTESKKFIEGSGYLHVLKETEWSKEEWKPEKKELPEHNEVMATMARKFYLACDEEQQVNADERLGISHQSLRRLGMGWCASQSANTFPMFRHNRRVIGIRMRGTDGRKWAIKGSKQGLFIPSGLSDAKALFICEGPTDTAAMLDLGFAAIGRPSCMGATELIVEVAANRYVIIMADGDGPGMDGATRLAYALKKIARRVITMSPPAGYKDVRAWYRGGELRKEEALQHIKAASCQHGHASSPDTTSSLPTGSCA